MSRIGRAVIEVLLKSDQAKADAKALKQEVSALGSTGSNAGGLGAAGAQAEVFSAGLLTAAAAAVTLGISLAKAIDTWLNWSKDSQDETDKVTAGVRGLRDELAREASFTIDTSAAEKKIQQIGRKVQAAIGNMNESAGDGGFLANFAASFGFDGALNSKLNNLYSNANQLAAVARNDAKRIRAEQAAEDLRAAEDQKIARLEGIEKINAEQKKANDELTRREQNAKTPEEKDAIAKRRRETDATFDYRREKIRIEEADKAIQEKAREDLRRGEREQRDKESAERVARHAAEAFARETERALKDLYTGIERASAAQSSATTQALAGVTADVSRIASLIDLRLLANPIDRR